MQRQCDQRGANQQHQQQEPKSQANEGSDNPVHNLLHMRNVAQSSDCQRVKTLEKALNISVVSGVAGQRRVFAFR
jgi:hypothetical protein